MRLGGGGHGVKKSDLVDRLATRHDRQGRKRVELAVNTVLEAVVQAMADGRRVELRDFGAFSVKQKAPRIGRNPRSGTAVMLGVRRLAYFRSGKEMPGRLNAAAE
jgi:integration host factor subunit beta